MSGELNAAADAGTGAVQRWGGQVPIVIGAAGHRNIFPADGKLAAAVRGECRRLRKLYGASPFAVLSPLAEGADRMIAQIAMEELRADLIAVLPMPADEYKRDFKTDDSKAEFDAFLKRALFVKTAPMQEGEAWKADGEARDTQYARAGAIVADHAQILLAIWDGLEARGTGGTGQQVAWFGRGYSPAIYAQHKGALSPLTPPEPGLLIRIDPATAQVTAGEAGQRQTGKSSIRSILERTDKYNRDVSLSRNIIAQAKPLAPDAADEIAGLKLTEAVYQAADAISVDCAKKVRNAESWIYFLAFGSILSLNIINLSIYLPWIYLGVTIVMAALAGRIRVLSVGNRYIEYRGLAEAMRTLYFWRIAGVEDPVWVFCLPRRPGVVHWIAQAARAIEFFQSFNLPERKNGSIETARKYWVDDQRDWLSRKENENIRRFNFGRRIVLFSIFGSFGTAFLIAWLTLATDAHGGLLWDAWVKPDIFAAGWQVLLGIFAIFELSGRDNRIHLELAKQYAVQRDVFESAHRQLAAAGTPQEGGWTPAQVLEKLGEETLQAQAEWLWREHTKPFEAPQA
jgi:hypothetical protein